MKKLYFIGILIMILVYSGCAKQTAGNESIETVVDEENITADNQQSEEFFWQTGE